FLFNLVSKYLQPNNRHFMMGSFSTLSIPSASGSLRNQDSPNLPFLAQVKKYFRSGAMQAIPSALRFRS
ncbi:MAG: hypothetical protein AB8G86_15940, partial [Saprospiraceae bacterium]